jgi:L-2-hydroxyglutarate oxidase LhgO
MPSTTWCCVPDCTPIGSQDSPVTTTHRASCRSAGSTSSSVLTVDTWSTASSTRCPAREGYRRRDLSVRDLSGILSYSGFWRFARQHWRTGVGEMHGSLSKRAFMTAAQRYVPELRVEDVVAGPAGIRAQALERDGSLVDDFRITRRGPVLAVRNAPSPAATSSLAIAEHLVDILLGQQPSGA